MSDKAASKSAAPSPSEAPARIYIDNSNSTELKLTCDEAVERILTSNSTNPWRASHLLVDIRLVLGFIASIEMIGVSAWAWKIVPEWNENKGLTAVAVAVYMVLSGIQTALAYLEGDTIFRGAQSSSDASSSATSSSQKKLRISSGALPKAQTDKEASKEDGRKWTTPPVYELELEWSGAKVRKSGKEKINLGHMGEWFTQEGEFVEDIFSKKLLAAIDSVLA
ncbi:hypothetical protein IE81DRAFT_321503 [Ceraceosorus guamensis]|uniref:Signal peptidase complex subunit 2 n=1 Tax=Ceraceosorus guamensis TaxID=1522189 RepID=A0A316W3A1_9BASI|nr:hypothetical protein IE81DRAFT_321503 [Ceraceosorus guamensis]PWN44346.1 hypothetical protein IE81DRAFT_321503 [Ceraceosorus guamensis]